MEVTRFSLENGLAVVVVPRPGPVLAAQLWVGAGSADEPLEQAGIAHLTEHVLVRGAIRRGEARALEQVGGELNAWTSFDHTVFHAVAPAGEDRMLLEVVAGLSGASLIEEAELVREREVVLAEIRQGADDPQRAAARGLFAAVHREHPYQRPVIGRERSVRRLGRADIVEYCRHCYAGPGSVLVVVGDLEPSRVRRQARRAFAHLSARRPRRARPVEPRRTSPRVARELRAIEEAHLAIGWQIPTVGAPEVAFLELAAAALGQGTSSRLARHRDRLDASSASLQLLRDHGLFVVNAIAGDAAGALAVIADELARLGDDLGGDEVERARTAIEAEREFSLETSPEIARRVGWWHTTARRDAAEVEHRAYLDEATARDVRRAVAKLLDPRRAAVAVVGPEARVPAAAVLTRQLRGGPHRIAAPDEPTTKPPPRRVAQAGSPRADAVVREQLPNGMVLVVKPDHQLPVVAMRAVWIGGVRRETAAKNGITSLLADVVTRGCASRSAREVGELTDRLGGAMVGAAGRNSFGLRAEWLARHWREGFELFADCVLSPSLDGGEIAAARRQLLSELEANAASPGQAAFRAFAETLYRVHPYRLDVLGSPSAVASLDGPDLAEFYRQNFPVGEMALAVVGDVDPEEVVAAVRARFSGAAAAKRAPSPPPNERFAGRPLHERQVFVDTNRQQAHLVVGFPGTTVVSPDRFAVEVLAHVLGGPSGRLFTEVRQRQALAYRVSVHAVDGIDPGYLAIYVSVSPDKLDAAMAAIRREIDRIVADGITGDELAGARRQLLAGHAAGLEKRSAVATALAFHEAYGLGFAEWARYGERIRAVTVADVAAAARRYLSWDVAVTATVRPPTPTPGAERRARGRAKRGAR